MALGEPVPLNLELLTASSYETMRAVDALAAEQAAMQRAVATNAK